MKACEFNPSIQKLEVLFTRVDDRDVFTTFTVAANFSGAHFRTRFSVFGS